MIALGLFIVACGLGNAIRAFVDNFGSTLKCDPQTAVWAQRLARVGYFGRGVAMLPVGFFMLRAGWHEHAAEAKGVGGALWAVHGLAGGDVVLVSWRWASWPSAPSPSSRPGTARSARRRRSATGV